MKKISFRKILASTVISLFVVQIFYTAVFEPKLAVAATAIDSVIVTLNVTSGVAITNGADVTMSQPLGSSANQAIGASSWGVTTNSSSGYALTVTASTNPALKSSGNQFADASATPAAWSTLVPSSSYQFGFSANGTDADSAFGTATAVCGSGNIPDVTALYRGFAYTTPITIASTNSVTPVAGTTTNICFAAEQKGVFAPSGTYTATITGTATAS